MKKTTIFIIGFTLLIAMAALTKSFLLGKPNTLLRLRHTTSQEQAGTAAPTTSSNASPDDPIRIDQPIRNESLRGTIQVSGSALGSWFFEGSFPVYLVDGGGNVIARTNATTTADWMTDNLVPFTAKLDRPAKYTGDVELVFYKANPSGLPENEANVRMPITLAQ